MALWLLAIGLVTLLGQVVLLRELTVAFFGSELIYILSLGIWLFGSALGASLGRRTYLPSASRIRAALLAWALILPADLVLTRGLRLVLGAVPGAYPSFPRQLLGMAAVLLPLSVIAGLLFQWTAKRYVGQRRTLATAYALESAGALLGGALATLFLSWGTSNLAAVLLCGLAATAGACCVLREERPRWVTPPALVLATLQVLGLLLAPSIDHALTAWNHPRLLSTRDTPYGRMTITEAGGLVSVFENDALAYESQGTAAEEFAWLAAVQHPEPETALVLGGGFEGLVRELLRFGVDRIDYVELNAVLLDLVKPHLPEVLRESLADGGVQVTIADPRRFLDSIDSRDPTGWDLILVGMPEPGSAQTNRFYTREFFARCAAGLSHGGVLALRLRTAENLWTPQQTRRAASIHGALSSIFEEVVVLPGVTNVIVASRSPLTTDPRILSQRLDSRGLTGDLVIPAYVEYLYVNDRYFEIAETLEVTRAPVNSDVRPICYQYTLLLWLSRFYLEAALLDLPEWDLGVVLRMPRLWIGAVILAGIFLLSRPLAMVRRCFLAGVAGFSGMVLQTTLILGYQTSRGVLYQDLGILLTMFMAGLALGAIATDRWMRRRAEGSGRGSGLIWLLALLLLGALLAVSFGGGSATGLVTTSLLLVACGSLTAGVFAYASLEGQPDQRRTVSPLYAADLVGGCLGSLLASLFLIPVLGLAGSAWLVVLLAGLALLLI